MNAKSFLFAGLFTATMLPVLGEEGSFTADTSAPSKNWVVGPEHWDRLIVEKKEFPPINLGKSGFVLSGPWVDGFRRRRYDPDRTFTQKILGLPVIRLFVPGPMPSPPDSGGRYFAWRSETSRAWINASGGGNGADPFNLMNHEPKAALISIGK